MTGELTPSSNSKFITSNNSRVHIRPSINDDKIQYSYHPKCGQRLPHDLVWGEIDAESVEEIIEMDEINFCKKCFAYV